MAAFTDLSAVFDVERVTVDSINAFLRLNPLALRAEPDSVRAMLQSFVEQNDDPSAPDCDVSEGPDDVSRLVGMLADAEVRENRVLFGALLQTVKILLRKRVNRAAFGRAGVEAVASAMRAPSTVRIAREAANVVLNMCYDRDLVEAVVELGIVQPLVAYLATSDEELQASASGALQSLCFQVVGRYAVIECEGALPSLVALLNSSALRVTARCVGALHNLSSDVTSIRRIRELGAIPQLVALLRAPSSSICGSAAGTLQNLCREESCRADVLGAGGLPLLTDLLFSSSTTVQAFAAGALLNLLGASYARGSRERETLTAALADSIAVGAVLSCVLSPVT